eukprot:COSAG02_NODE_1675_length_11374_cov_3.988559_4_plen_73_part_00
MFEDSCSISDAAWVIGKATSVVSTLDSCPRKGSPVTLTVKLQFVGSSGPMKPSLFARQTAVRVQEQHASSRH